MTSGAQAIFVALAHGVAVWPDGGGLKISAVAASIPAAGVEYLKKHKAEILNAFSEIGAVQVLNSHLREYGPRLVSELMNEYHALIEDRRPSLPEFMQTWARVLYCDCLKSWPPVEATE